MIGQGWVTFLYLYSRDWRRSRLSKGKKGGGALLPRHDFILWSEYMTNEEMVEYQALPRMTALAEVQWTQPERKDFDSFKQRLTGFTQYLDYLHYRYCKHLWPERQIPSRWRF